jgi:hypothetical protein
MTGAAHIHQVAGWDTPTTWSSHRLAVWLALAAGAIVLLLGGYALAAHLRAHPSPLQQLHVPMATSPGAQP